MRASVSLAVAALMGAAAIGCRRAPPTREADERPSGGTVEALSSVPRVADEPVPALARERVPAEAVELLAGVTLPVAASSRPAPDAWASAAPVALFRAPPPCAARRVREWVRVRCCGERLVEATLLAGTDEGLSLAVAPDAVEITFPVRRGDRRVVDVTQRVAPPAVRYDAVGSTDDVVTALVLSELWLDDAPAPIVTIKLRHTAGGPAVLIDGARRTRP